MRPLRFPSGLATSSASARASDEFNGSTMIGGAGAGAGVGKAGLARWDYVLTNSAGTAIREARGRPRTYKSTKPCYASAKAGRAGGRAGGSARGRKVLEVLAPAAEEVGAGAAGAGAQRGGVDVPLARRQPLVLDGAAQRLARVARGGVDVLVAAVAVVVVQVAGAGRGGEEGLEDAHVGAGALAHNNLSRGRRLQTSCVCVCVVV